MMMNRFSLIAIIAIAASGLVACDKKEDPPPQYPQQPYPGQYPQQPGAYPQQPGAYPQQPGAYPQQPGAYPQPYPPQTAPAPMPAPMPPAVPAPAPAADTPTAVPGVMKRANGTCYITPPSLDGNPAQPMDVMCPPG